MRAAAGWWTSRSTLKLVHDVVVDNNNKQVYKTAYETIQFIYPIK